MKVPLFLVGLMFISIVLADYGHLKIDYEDKLEFQLSDGTWGTVCSKGFDSYAASAACKQLGYTTYNSYYSTEYLSNYDDSPAICSTNCYGYESRLTSCYLQQCSDYNYYSNYHSSYDRCSYVVTLNCDNDNYNNYDNNYSSDDDTGSSSGATIGGIVAGVSIFVFFVFIITCRLYIRYSYYARRNQGRTVIVTQRRTPRILIARVTRTLSSRPAPPPAYTPSAPNDGYAPVPPRGYQPVPTTDYAPANTAARDDNIPSDPPPEYTPAVSTNAQAPPVNQNSTQ